MIYARQTEKRNTKGQQLQKKKKKKTKIYNVRESKYIKGNKKKQNETKSHAAGVRESVFRMLYSLACVDLLYY